MKFSYLCLAVVIALVATTAFANESHLSAKFASLFTPTGQFTDELKAEVCKFDKVSLNGFKGADWIGVDPSAPTHYKYTLTFCDTAPEASCKDAKGSLCQYDATKSNLFVGSLASFTEAPAPAFAFIDPKNEDSGYQLTFTNGAKCKTGFSEKDRTVLMKFTCDDSKSERKFSILEEVECSYEIDIATKFACPGGGSDGISGGAIVLIIIFSVALVYVLAGCIICVAKFGKPFGMEACPQKDFWCALPGLYVAGLKFTGGKIAGCFGSKTITSSSGEYEQA